MIWRVQTAWAQGLHPAFIGREQHLAERDVSRLLGTWIVKNLMQLASHPRILREHGNFALQAQLVASGIVNSLNVGDIWGAYDRFHSFMDKFEDEFDAPIWGVVGTVIVEAPPGRGPSTRKSFLTEDDLEQLPEGGIIRLDGSVLAGLRRWKIAWSDHLGERHTSIFIKEEEALRHLRSHLEELANRLRMHFMPNALLEADEELASYADEALAIAAQIRHLLHAGLVREAYNRWRWFETEWQGSVQPSILQSMIGTVRLEVD